MGIVDRKALYEQAYQKHAHLRKYLDDFVAQGNELPEFYVQLHSDMAKLKHINFLYPVGDPIFIHCVTVPDVGKRYITIEPNLTDILRFRFDEINEAMLREAPTEEVQEGKAEFGKVLEALLGRVTIMEKEKVTFFAKRFPSLYKRKIFITKEDLETVKYFLRRNIIENGPLEPITRDQYIEDIHSVGVDWIHIVHKIFGMMQTNVKFPSEMELDDFLRSMSERIGRPVSDAKPIIDGALPDGSRINIVYSNDVSRRGASFTIRKFTEKPLTVTQLISFGTFNAQIGAYMWLCLEHGMSCIVSGETASGKTTTLNAILTFIDHTKKVYSAEDTPEVIAPQPVWQRLVTRDTGQEAGKVELFDLVRTALRSRPDYIIVGETRGREGAMMFQAMQTGHSVLSTFHAPSTTQMIQRFTGDPINVPIRFIDNLNVAFFQQILYEEGRLIRRIVSVDEILRYSKELDGVMVRSVFKWDPYTDTHYFRGMNNSYILEEKIAPQLKFEDKRMIYTELAIREQILKNMIDHNILQYEDVNKIMNIYYTEGLEALPPEILPEGIKP
jgi:archaeal flagellar protein FlaI